MQIRKLMVPMDDSMTDSTIARGNVFAVNGVPSQSSARRIGIRCPRVTRVRTHMLRTGHNDVFPDGVHDVFTAKTAESPVVACRPGVSAAYSKCPRRQRTDQLPHVQPQLPTKLESLSSTTSILLFPHAAACGCPALCSFPLLDEGRPSSASPCLARTLSAVGRLQLQGHVPTPWKLELMLCIKPAFPFPQ